MEFIASLKEISFAGNTAYSYALAAAVFVGAFLVLKLIQILLLARLRNLAKRTKTDFDDVLVATLQGVKPPFYLLVALYFSLTQIAMDAIAEQVVTVAFAVAIMFEVVRGLERLLDWFIAKRVSASEEEPHANTIIRSAGSVGKGILWLLGIVAVLANVGVNVTSFIAGLGIGGVAIALALQSVLGDLFSSVSILVDKPFKVGDFIVIGNDMGTVDRIGLKSTRIRTLHGEELVVSNRDLTESRVQNFKRMERRRVVLPFGVVYGLPAERLEKIPGIIRGIVESVEGTNFDRCHFKSYGDSSLDYETVFYVDTPDYNIYMDRLQQVNLGIYRAFEKEMIDFAYPTRTVHLIKADA